MCFLELLSQNVPDLGPDLSHEAAGVSHDNPRTPNVHI